MKTLVMASRQSPEFEESPDREQVDFATIYLVL